MGGERQGSLSFELCNLHPWKRGGYFGAPQPWYVETGKMVPVCFVFCLPYERETGVAWSIVTQGGDNFLLGDSLLFLD